MTTVNLRKANEYERALAETAKRFKFGRTIPVSIHQEDSVADLVDEALTTLRANVTNAILLARAAHGIRAAISEANSSSGINALLSEKASLEAEEKILGAVLSGAENGFGHSGDYELDRASDVPTAQKQLEMARARAVTDSYIASDAVTVRVLNAETVETLTGDLASIRLRKRAIADDLLGLNMTTKITLTSETVALLKQYRLVA